MNKETKRFLAGSVAILSLVVAGCSQSKTTPESAKETTEAKTTKQAVVEYTTDSKNPATSFDWNAKVAPMTKYEQTFVETNGGKTVTKKLDGVQKAVDALNEKKKSITDKKVKEALKLVDAVFVNQENFDVLLKATGTSSQEEFFTRIWNDYMVNFLKEARPTYTNDGEVEYQGVKYPIKVYGPMYLKVNTNALGRAAAYTLEDYKVEGDTVYLKLKAPRVDTYQYEVQASYQTNNKAFFEGMLQDAQKVGQTDFTKALLYKFIYRLAAVGFRGDGYVNLEGMDYYDKNNHYLAIKVDDKGNATIDDKNLVDLLQIDLKPANEANKAKFE
ncbi:hypothetical protein GMC90_01680 [Streptococcus parasanguinis]|uniref:Lipoprotein n=1 Tax=Streptococcus parasanguinis TaxID=1318 RepID=A0A6A8V3G5_STRPA|nr:hypothetical protein [Streptococcus parasanguinis]MTR67330.1 hypothetical protein [Streptococcus parasanguinis]MTS00562.1 hypothetical protein [Streptococcus parasanguinis]